MMIVDNTHLYWIKVNDQGNGSQCTYAGGQGPYLPPGGSGSSAYGSADLMRVDKATGKDAQTIFSGTGLTSIGQDSANIYWHLYEWGVLGETK